MSTERAAVLVGLERWSEAKDALAPVLADPNAGAEAWCLLASCQLGLRDLKAARTAAERAIAIEPEAEWGHRVLAIVLLGLGRPAPARKAAERALALAPDLPETTHVLVAVVLAGRWPKGMAEVAERCLAINPHRALAWQTAAMVAAHRRDWVQTERLARGGLAIDPQDADLMLLLGTALQGQGKRAEAADSYAAAVRTDPTDQRGRQALGRIGMSVGGAGLVAKVVFSVLAVNNLTRVLRESWQQPRLMASILAAVLAVAFLYQELRHRRAVARISPQLRAPALAERRRAARGWLLLVALVAAGLAGIALLAADLVAFGVLMVIAGGALGWRDRTTPATELSDSQWIRQRVRSLAQASRWRFR